MNWLWKFFSGGVIDKFTAPLLEAYKARTAAKNDAARIEAEKTIASLEAARDIALAEASDRWSAVRIGRLLIVVPFGMWWAAIYLVQIINPWLGLSLVVIDVPPRIHDMALVLIPAILLGDAGAFIARRVGRK